MAETARLAALAAVTVLLSGCTVFGGAGTVRLDGATVEATSRSASIGADGVSARSSRTVVTTPTQ